ncbi:MAG: alpha/beta hydrolase, partial [Bacteroidota bacterium]
MHKLPLLLLVLSVLFISCSSEEPLLPGNSGTTNPGIPSSSANIYCSSLNRFSTIELFTDADIEAQKDVIYGSAMNRDGNLQALAMDIYSPSLDVDQLERKPFLMTIHGGGFTGGNKNGWEAESREFAKRGFVVASISYRLGRDETDTLSSFQAVYRAQQDAMAALRYIVSEADVLGIDTAWIFIGGSSAGSITAQHTNYMSQEDWDTFNPQLRATLGPINTSGNNLTNTYTIKGIYNNWGSVYGPAITVEEMVPTVAFHSEIDNTVPIGIADGNQFGSSASHRQLTNNNVCSELTVRPGVGHSIYRDEEGTRFRVNRASCFFKSVMCEECNSFFAEEQVFATCR